MLDNLKMNDYVEIPYITPSGEKITYYCGACGFMSTQFFYGDAYSFTNELKGNRLYEEMTFLIKKSKQVKLKGLKIQGFLITLMKFLLVQKQTNCIFCFNVLWKTQSLKLRINFCLGII